MTGDARGEAEQIVDALAMDAAYLANMIAADRQGDFPDSDELRAEVAERNRVGNERRDRLVAALAAAIDHVTANDDVPDDYSVGSWDMDADTFRTLREALSALRARAGEETG